MNKILLTLLTLFSFFSVDAQNFTGQWKGFFADKSTSFVGWGGDQCEYVLELTCKGKKITGYSYTYFNEGGYKYYTICKLKGTVDPKSHSVEVIETERTKTNVPYNIRNCFQIHRLTFFKQGEEETLEGKWVPAPNQEGDCGYGTTVLSRRVLQKITPQYNKSQARVNNTTPKKKETQATQNTSTQKKTTTVTPPTVNNNNKKDTPAPTTPSVKIEHQMPPKPPVAKNEPPKNIETNKGFEKRNNNVLKTIEITNETFRVDLYDNGDIDGDTVSLFFNGALVMAKKRLSDKAISFDLHVDDNKDVNELVMYAENLGEIPPNTALMIVTDGNKRYEVRITSDLQKSGVIRFVHKE